MFSHFHYKHAQKRANKVRVGLRRLKLRRKDRETENKVREATHNDAVAREADFGRVAHLRARTRESMTCLLIPHHVLHRMFHGTLYTQREKKTH